MTIDVFPGSHHADLRYGNTARTAAFSAAANNDDTRMTTMCIWKVAQSKPSSQQKIDLNLSPGRRSLSLSLPAAKPQHNLDPQTPTQRRLVKTQQTMLCITLAITDLKLEGKEDIILAATSEPGHHIPGHLRLELLQRFKALPDFSWPLRNSHQAAAMACASTTFTTLFRIPALPSLILLNPQTPTVMSPALFSSQPPSHEYPAKPLSRSTKNRAVQFPPSFTRNISVESQVTGLFHWLMSTTTVRKQSRQRFFSVDSHSPSSGPTGAMDSGSGLYAGPAFGDYGILNP
ncbi:hypothetical protein JHW43_002044 [Diplocarpon mali]|nr:hypothetical protein JHW43_002044 [Diplocarpon mali]